MEKCNISDELRVEVSDYITKIEMFLNTVDILNGYQKFYAEKYSNFWRFEEIINLLQESKKDILLKSAIIKQLI